MRGKCAAFLDSDFDGIDGFVTNFDLFASDARWLGPCT